jgi:hypothetical protein
MGNFVAPSTDTQSKLNPTRANFERAFIIVLNIGDRRPSAPRSRQSADRQRGSRRRIISPGAMIVVEAYAEV